MFDFSIYPLELPEITFRKNLDFLLMELPPRYMPMMPNGLGHVENILNSIDINYQIFDANIILYHIYHSNRILNNLDCVYTSSGFKFPTDPWDNTFVDDWDENDEIINYFQFFIDKITLEIVKAKPKILGFSLNGNNIKFSKRMVASIRELLPECIIVVGGYTCVFYDIGPKVFTDFDYMVIGESELSLVGLVRSLLQDETPKDLPGIVSKFDTRGREFVSAPLLHDLDSIDFPRYQWINYKLYVGYNGYRLIPIAGSRGCVWSRCTFCSEKFFWRRRSPERIVDEFQWHNNRGGNLFHFNESDLNGDPDALVVLCQEVIKRGLIIRFVGQLRIHQKSDRAFFDILKSAGFDNLRFGVDGWSKNTNRIQKKGYPMSLIDDNLKACHESGIGANVNIVIGVPGETEDDITETIERITKNKEYITKVEGINILILGYGSDFYAIPEKYNIKFIGNKEKIYKNNPRSIPAHLWYWEKDGVVVTHEDRINRLKRLANALDEIGLYVSPYADKRVKLRMSEGDNSVAVLENEMFRKETIKRKLNSLLFNKLVIYGTGDIARKIIELVDNKQNIIFTDSNVKYWNKKIYNIEIIPNTEILKYAKQVLIASEKFQSEIRGFLLDKYKSEIEIIVLGDIL